MRAMRWVGLVIVLTSSTFLLGAGTRGFEGTPPPAPADKRVAVIVNEKNPVTDLSLADLRAILKLERQFWPNGRRVALFLRPGESAESRVLLDKVYKTSHEKLQKYWVSKLFAGEIPAKPSYVPTAEAAGSRVREGEGAVSVVLSTEVPKDVRVLSIDGRRPDHAEYALR